MINYKKISMLILVFTLMISIVHAENVITINKGWVEQDSSNPDKYYIAFEVVDQNGNVLTSVEGINYQIEMEVGGMKAPVLNNDNFDEFENTPFKISARSGSVINIKLTLEKEGYSTEYSNTFNVGEVYSEEQKQTNEGSCQETDEGLDYFNKGNIVLTRSDGEVFEYEDICHGNSLNEYNCEYARINQNVCKEGCDLDSQVECAVKCEDGRCVPFADIDEIEIISGKLTDLSIQSGYCTYFSNGQCISVNSIFKKDNKIYHIKYGKIVESKKTGENCDFDYECIINNCKDHICVADEQVQNEPKPEPQKIAMEESKEDSKPGFFSRIINWFKNLFG